MVALMLIGFGISLLGWSLIQIVPTPSKDSPWWQFTPIFMYLGGIVITLVSAIVLAWEKLP